MKTAKEALQALHDAAFDVVLKNHDPAVGINACRFLRKASSSIPVVGAPRSNGLLPYGRLCTLRDVSV